MLGSERGASMIIVQHIGRERSLQLIPVGVLDNLPFGLFFLFFFACFRGAGTGANSCGNSLSVLFLSLVLVSASRLRLLVSLFENLT